MLPRLVEDLITRYGPPCTEVTRLASDSLERKLSLFERFKMKFHFRICVWCERYLTHLRVIRGELRRHPEELENQEAPPPAGLSPEAHVRIKRTLNSPK